MHPKPPFRIYCPHHGGNDRLTSEAAALAAGWIDIKEDPLGGFAWTHMGICPVCRKNADREAEAFRELS